MQHIKFALDLLEVTQTKKGYGIVVLPLLILQSGLTTLSQYICHVFAQWEMKVNTSKTEKTRLVHLANRVSEPWRARRKLGSLLGEREDALMLSRRVEIHATI